MYTCIKLFLRPPLTQCYFCQFYRNFNKLGVQLANEKEFPYYPTQYFRRRVANWLVNTRQRVLLHKESYLRQTYSLPDEDAQFPTPFSYKQYCRNILDRHFWGDAVILYMVSCVWVLKVMVVNSQTLQQYKVRHTAGLKDADITLVFNASCHYCSWYVKNLVFDK